MRSGRFHRSYPGVYSLGRPPTSASEHRMAAVLACGARAALSHAAAGANLGMRASAATVIDVTSPTGAGRCLEGDPRPPLDPARRRSPIVDGIPTTTCARTLLDLAAILHPEALAEHSTAPRSCASSTSPDLKRSSRATRSATACLPLRRCFVSPPPSEATKNDFERRLFALLSGVDLPPTRKSTPP